MTAVALSNTGRHKFTNKDNTTRFQNEALLILHQAGSNLVDVEQDIHGLCVLRRGRLQVSIQSSRHNTVARQCGNALASIERDRAHGGLVAGIDADVLADRLHERHGEAPRTCMASELCQGLLRAGGDCALGKRPIRASAVPCLVGKPAPSHLHPDDRIPSRDGDDNRLVDLCVGLDALHLGVVRYWLGAQRTPEAARAIEAP